jgi:RNA-directed DNA polymerase
MLSRLTDFAGTQGGIFDRVVSVPALYLAWRKVRANRGAAGVDAVSLQVFEERLHENLKELSRSLLSGAYQPLPARFVTITKDDGKERELAILTVRDRVAQRAVLDAIEPLIEPLLLDCSFAFRQGRNVEMAIQRMIAARANGFWWTVESDVQDFFGSIERRLMLRELEAVVPDEKVLRLVQAWLDAGALEETHLAQAGWLRQGKAAWANVQLMLRESVNQSLDDYVAQQLGVNSDSLISDDWTGAQATEETHLNSLADYQATAQHQTRRAVVMRLLQDGALLAWSQRALLGRLMSVKVLGFGGLAAAGVMLAPKAMGLYRNYFQTQYGTLQGSPISPLLTNFYMTAFDKELVEQRFRLIRYCDDFVVQCRTEEEAQAALQAANGALRQRRLQMHPDKTRIIAPDGEFEFLGYQFLCDGRVIPPPSVPEQMAQRIRELARHARLRMPGSSSRRAKF